MIMKTSVLLSWEFPDNYNSPTPYKVQTARAPSPWSGRARLRAGAWPGLGLSWTGAEWDQGSAETEAPSVVET